jgi:hypothetical protein
MMFVTVMVVSVIFRLLVIVPGDGQQLPGLNKPGGQLLVTINAENLYH